MVLQHVVVYRDDDCFCAWPFSGGLWQFADGEVVAGFTRARVDYADPKTVGHHHVERECGEHVLIRSPDRGRTWPAASLTPLYRRPEFDRTIVATPAATAADRSYDPRAGDYMLISGFGNPIADKPGHAFVMVSTDRGRTWHDPVRLPTWLPGADRYTWSFATGRPSYVVRDDGMLLLFASASRVPQHERWGEGAVPVVYASWNGGANWGFLTEIDPSPKQPMAVCPYPLLLADNTLLCAVRRQYSTASAFTQVYRSADGGRSWSLLSRVNDWGAPANLVAMPDGRIVCVYGYRQQPYGIRARVSRDQGTTWEREIVLRDDGGSWDLGYPRTLLLADGVLLTVYYINRKDDPIQQDGGVRHIAATLWTLD